MACLLCKLFFIVTKIDITDYCAAIYHPPSQLRKSWTEDITTQTKATSYRLNRGYWSESQAIKLGKDFRWGASTTRVDIETTSGVTFNLQVGMEFERNTMAVKAGNKYPATIFECRNFFSMCRNFLQGPTVQVSQQGRIIPGRRRLDPVNTTITRAGFQTAVEIQNLVLWCITVVFRASFCTLLFQ